MQNSILIAKLIGPVIAALGLTLLVNRGVFDRLIEEASSNKGLIVLMGVPTLLAGLAIVTTHNVWAWNWSVAITIFGWLAVVGGLLRTLLPGLVQALGGRVLKLPYLMTVAGVIWTGFGLYLSYYGYLA